MKNNQAADPVNPPLRIKEVKTFQSNYGTLRIGKILNAPRGTPRYTLIDGNKQPYGQRFWKMKEKVFSARGLVRVMGQESRRGGWRFVNAKGEATGVKNVKRAWGNGWDDCFVSLNQRGPHVYQFDPHTFETKGKAYRLILTKNMKVMGQTYGHALYGLFPQQGTSIVDHLE